MRKEDYKVALIVPVYNEHETIDTFLDTVYEKLASELNHLEIVFVDDGSKDDTVQIIREKQEKDNRISLICLSRNFGKEAAMSAALDLVQADAVVPIDVDLQDPPELILEFIRIWRDENIDDVYGVRTDRSKDTVTKRFSAEIFYYVFNKLANRIHIPENVGDFRLIDRKIIDVLKHFSERKRFMKALYAWPGFSSKGVGYSRPERVAGRTKWNYWKLWNFALDGIFSFTSLPLRVWARIPQELVHDIKQEVAAFEGVHGVFDVILHNYGPNILIGSLHINVYDTMNAHEIHGLTRNISEQMFEKHGIILTVGIYAIATGKNKKERTFPIGAL